MVFRTTAASSRAFSTIWRSGSSIERLRMDAGSLTFARIFEILERLLRADQRNAAAITDRLCAGISFGQFAERF
jgi:hypothetical protein